MAGLNWHSRRGWLRRSLIGVFGLMLAVALGPAVIPVGALAASPPPAPPVTWVSSYHDDALSWLTYQWRIRQKDIVSSSGVDVAGLIVPAPPNVDLTPLRGSSAFRVDELSVAEMAQTNSQLPELVDLRQRFGNVALEQQLYQSLKADGVIRPDVYNLLLIRARSVGTLINSRALPTQVTGGDDDPTHAEDVIRAVLARVGIKWDRAASLQNAVAPSRLFSDFSPCKRCGPGLPENTRVTAAVDYGQKKSARGQQLRDKLDEAEQVNANDGRGAQVQTIMNAPCPPSSGPVSSVTAPGAVLMAAGSPCGPEADATGGLARELAKPDSAPGGIDFSSLQLRYLADNGTKGLGYAFEAPPAAGPADRNGGVRVASEASDAFFVWLEESPSKFWVNLNPDEPDRIIDPGMGRTDVGRVMLEADLAMKKTVARLIHPDSALGTQFWQQLTLGSNNQSCLSMRQWIVPGQATVSQAGDELYILDAPLKVQMESDYLGTAGAASCPGQDATLEQHNETIYRSLILPQVEKAVNEAPEYADLRRMYLSRVAAEWYRQRSATHPTLYGKLIDQGNVSPWASRQPWTPRDVFDRYVQSYKNGEFKVTRQTQQGNEIDTWTYVYGGVDFTKISEHTLSAAEFQARFPGLATSVHRAQAGPAADPGGQGQWLGGTTTAHPAPGASLGPTLRLLLFALVVLFLVGALAAVGTVVWMTTRRT